MTTDDINLQIREWINTLACLPDIKNSSVIEDTHALLVNWWPYTPSEIGAIKAIAHSLYKQADRTRGEDVLLSVLYLAADLANRQRQVDGDKEEPPVTPAVKEAIQSRNFHSQLTAAEGSGHFQTLSDLQHMTADYLCTIGVAHIDWEGMYRPTEQALKYFKWFTKQES